MTWQALLLLAAAISATNAQNVTLAGNFVPIEKLVDVPGSTIAILTPEEIPDYDLVMTHWLSVFPQMAASQRLAVFLQLSQWQTEKRQKLELVTPWLRDSPSLLTRFLTTEEFSQQVDLLSDGLRGKSRQAAVDVVSNLPDYALMAWLEKLLNNGTLEKNLFEEENFNATHIENVNGLSILGLTCAQLSTVPATDVLFYMDLYNNASQSRVVPFALLQCFKAKLATYLREADPSFTEGDTVTLLDRISAEDLSKIDSRVLASFSTANFTRMANRDLLVSSLKKIGSDLPMKDVIVVMSSDKFVNLSAEFAGSNVSLGELGSFVHATGEEIMGSFKEEVSALTRQLWQHKEQATLCASDLVRGKWRMGLINVFGSLDKWTRNTLLTVGDLLINLTPSDWNHLSPKELRDAADMLIANTGYLQSYNQMPSYTNETVFYKVCAHWLGDDEGRKFAASHLTMMRNLLLASQLNFDKSPQSDVFLKEHSSVPADGQRRRRRSAAFDSLLEDLAGEYSSERLTFRLHKRQTGGKRVSYSVNTISQFYRAAIGIFNKKLSSEEIPQDRINAVGVGVNQYKNNSAVAVQEALQLPELPLNDFIVKFNKAIGEQTITPEDARTVRQKIMSERLKLMRSIVASLDLHPDDFPTEVAADHEVFCQYANTARFCSAYSPEDQVNPLVTDETLPSAVGCGGLGRAGKEVAQVALKKEDVGAWTKEALKECLSDLGRLELDLDLKQAIWKILYEKEVDFSRGDHFRLRNLLEAAVYNETDLEQRELKAAHLEHLALIGAHTYPEDILKAAVDHMISQTGEDFPAQGDSTEAQLKNILVFGSMGHLVCGFRDEVLTELLRGNETAATLLPIFGQLQACPNKDALIIMANKAQNLYGNASAWSPALVRSMGLIVSGLAKPHILPPRSFAAIDAKAVAHAEGSLFEALSPEHFAAFPVEALSSIDVRHFKRLPKQWSVTMLMLEEDLPSGRIFESMRVYQGEYKEEHEAAKKKYMEHKNGHSAAVHVENSLLALVVCMVAGVVVRR